MYRKQGDGLFARVYCGSGPAYARELDAWIVIRKDADGPRLRLARDEAGLDLVPTPEEQAHAEVQRAKAATQLADAATQRADVAEQARRGVRSSPRGGAGGASRIEGGTLTPRTSPARSKAPAFRKQLEARLVSEQSAVSEPGPPDSRGIVGRDRQRLDTAFTGRYQ